MRAAPQAAGRKTVQFHNYRCSLVGLVKPDLIRSRSSIGSVGLWYNEGSNSVCDLVRRSLLRNPACSSDLEDDASFFSKEVAILFKVSGTWSSFSVCIIAILGTKMTVCFY